MGIEHSYVEEHDLSLWRYDRVIDAATLGECDRLLSEDGPRPTATLWFVDMTNVEKIDLRFPDMQRFTEDKKPVRAGRRGRVRVAVLYSSDLVLGMLRMFETLMSGESLDIGVFTSVGECARFLDVPPAALGPE